MNKAIEGLDPFDLNLTAEQKAAVLNECRINPEYFLENCVRKSLVPREDWNDNQRFTDYVNTLTNLPIEPGTYRILTLPVRRQRQSLVRKVRRPIAAYFDFMEREEALRFGHGRWKAGNPDGFTARMNKVREERLALNALFELGHRILHNHRTGEKDH